MTKKEKNKIILVKKLKEDKTKKLGGFIINNDNALKVMHEIQGVFEKHKLSMMEITHIVDTLANGVKETNKFKDKLTSMEASKITLGMMMQDKQLKEDL